MLLAPALVPLILVVLAIIPLVSFPFPKLDQELIPSYKKYAQLMGADWQLVAAYDLAIHKNQADKLDPESAAWFFVSVEFGGRRLSGRNSIISFLGENLNFEEAMKEFIERNQSSETEIYDIGSKDIVSLEQILDDKTFKWIEDIVSKNMLASMSGDEVVNVYKYRKIILESKGYFSVPLPHGSYTISKRGFGFRMHPIKKVRKFHSGQDFGAATGTPVGASADGVASVRWDPDGYGKYIILTHSNGLSTLYAHLSAVHITKGSQVKKGDVIGLVGSTGGSTGPHLHFEIRKNGQYLDPMKFLK